MINGGPADQSEKLAFSGAERNRAADLHDAAARWRAPDAELDAAANAAGNVVPLRRGHQPGQPRQATPTVETHNILPRILIGEAQWPVRFAALLALSAAVHVGLYFPFHHEPEPMASLGEISVAVDLVLGANQHAGLIHDGGVTQVSSPAPAQAPDAVPSEVPVEAAAPVKVTERRPIETAKTAPTTEPTTEQVQPSPVEAPTTEERPAVQAVAPVEISTQPPAPAPVQAHPQPVESGELQVAVNPEISETTRVAQTQQAVTPPTETAREKRERETPRAAVSGERNQSQSTASASSAAGGVGRGQSQEDNNYRGRVAAHLTRHKRFPPEARQARRTGSATVAFSLDDGGHVTSVTLLQGSGVASLDREAVAMVQRASPFPRPPSGRGQSFTVPVSFRLN